MASERLVVDQIIAACGGAGEVSARPMFGEYGLYCGGKLVGTICDNQLFVTITPAGRLLLDETHDAPPYPGAKPKLRVPRERWEDEPWLADLIRATAGALPLPPPKRK